MASKATDPYKVTIKTTPNPDGSIHQETKWPESMTGQLVTSILKTQDNEIAKALQRLGWTPPAMTNKVDRLVQLTTIALAMSPGDDRLPIVEEIHQLIEDWRNAK